MGLTKSQKIASAERKALKEMDQIRSERKKSPEVMWETLLDGEVFEDVKFKNNE